MNNNYTLTIKLISIITIIAFIFTMIGNDVLLATAWAEPDYVTVNDSYDNNLPFSLPEPLGEIREAWCPDKNISGVKPPVIIHIQDAHCNYDAQKRIADIIEYFNKEYGITSVNLEGGTGHYDLSLFGKNIDTMRKRRMTERLLKEGVINGAEYFTVNNTGRVSLWGVEDVDLYLKNLLVYRDVIKNKKEIRAYLGSIKNTVEILKKNIYSKELLLLDNWIRDYRAENITLKEYAANLIKKAEELGVDPGEFKNVNILFESIKGEEKIDFEEANAERDILIDNLYEKLSDLELEELLDRTLKFREEKISQKEFYTYLIDKAGTTTIRDNTFRELIKYCRYISEYEDIDLSVFIKELEKFKDRIKKKLFRSGNEKELDKLDVNLGILEDFFDITLTRSDYDRYLKNKEEFTGNYFRDKLSDLVLSLEQEDRDSPVNPGNDRIGDDSAYTRLSLSGLTGQFTSGGEFSLFNSSLRANEMSEAISTLLLNLGKIDRYISKMDKFYKYSFKRDEVFLENIRFNDMRGGGGKTAILITGGFHSENLYALFKEKNISYVSVIPEFKNEEGYVCPYFELLSGKKNGFKNFINTSFFNISIFSYFCGRYSKKVYGMSSGDFVRGLRRLAAGDISELSVPGLDIKILLSEDIPDYEDVEELEGVLIRGKKVWEVKNITSGESGGSKRPVQFYASFLESIKRLLSGNGRGAVEVLRAYLYAFRDILRSDFDDYKKEVIKRESREVVDMLLPHKSDAAKLEISQDISDRTSPISFWNWSLKPFTFYSISIFLAITAVSSLGLFLPGIYPEISLLFLKLVAGIYMPLFYIAGVIFAAVDYMRIYHSGNFYVSSKNNREMFGWVGMFIPEAKKSRIFLSAWSNKYIFEDAMPHEIVHYLKGSGYINEDINIPVAVLTGLFRKYRMALNNNILSRLAVLGDVYAYGYDTMMENDSFTDSMYEDLIMRSKKYIIRDQELRAEPLYTYILGEMLFGVGVALSEKTGRPEDMERFIYLLSRGIDPTLAVECVKNGLSSIRLYGASEEKYHSILADMIKNISENEEIGNEPFAAYGSAYPDSYDEGAIKGGWIKDLFEIYGLSDSEKVYVLKEVFKSNNRSTGTDEHSFIGKIIDKNGSIIKKITSVRTVEDKKELEIASDNTDRVIIPFYPIGSAPLTIEAYELRNRLNAVIAKEGTPGHITPIVSDLAEKIGSDVKRVVALEDHETVKGAFGQDSTGENVLFINYKLINEPLALLHEIGEGYAVIPEGYNEMTRHTFMRGAGKDLRRAYMDLEALTDEETLNDMSEGEFVSSLERELAKMDTVRNISRNRAPPEGEAGDVHTYISPSELALIRWNYANGQKGFKSLFGIQDHLSNRDNSYLSSRITRPKNIIDPKDPSSGRRLADAIARISAQEEFDEKNIHEYAQLLYSGYYVLSEYFESLNDNGLLLMEDFFSYIGEYESGKVNWEGDFSTFKEMVSKIPNIDDPNDDLFFDFDLTDEQFELLIHNGYKGFLNIQISGGACPNQCAICGVGRARGVPIHIPFPLIAKMLRRSKDKQTGLIPYFKSDPVFYQDKVIGAALPDVLRFAKNVCGFDKFILVSHGLPGKGNREKLKRVINDMEEGTSISFHVYHSAVIDNIITQYQMEKGKGVPDPLKLEDQRTKLMKSYRERYVNMIEGFIKKGNVFNIRLYRPYFEAEEGGRITREYPASAEILRRIISFQDELFLKVRDDILEHTGVDLRQTAFADTFGVYGDNNAKYITPTHIIWTDDAIDLLKYLAEKVDGIDFAMDISEDTFFLDDERLTPEVKRFKDLIMDIQEAALKDQSETVVESKFSIVLRPEHADGSKNYDYKIVMQVKEGISGIERFRTVKEMFGGGRGNGSGREGLVRTDRFLVFLRYLQLLQYINNRKRRYPSYDDYSLQGVRRKYRDLSVEIQRDVRNTFSASARSFIAKEKEEGRTGTIEEFFNDITLSINGEINKYFDIVSNFFTDRDRLGELLDDPEANIRELYELLKDVPFPVVFSGVTAFRYPAYSARNFADFSGDNANMDKDILHSFHEFVSPVKVFKENLSLPGSIKRTGLIGKLLDKEGNIVEKITSAKEIENKDLLEITADNTHTVRIQFHLSGDKVLTLDMYDLRSRLERLVSAEGVPAHIKPVVSGLVERIGPGVKKVIALSDHETVMGAFGEDASGEKVLFLNHKLIDTPMVLFHELGEGYAEVPEGYEDITRHTFMRGAGKDIRQAYKKLLSDLGKEPLSGKTESEFIKLLEEKLAKLYADGDISKNRAPPGKRDTAHTYVTPSELSLIKWNYAHGQTGINALYGIQDHLSNVDNTELSEKILNKKEKGYRLAQLVTVIKMVKDRGGRTEEDYRNMDMQALFDEDRNVYPSDSEIRLDTYMTHQAADSGQAIIELLANAQDASTPGKKKVGRFGVGGYQVLGELVDDKGRDIPGARVILESSKDGVNGVRFTFYRDFGDTLFDYEVFSNGEIKKGTKIKALKKLNPVEIQDRRRFVSKKVRVNTRGAIRWSGTGELLNTPEDYEFLNGVERYGLPPESEVPAVYVDINEDGYEVSDSGTGMGFKDIVERFLIPKSGDKPLTGETEIEIAEEIRMFYKPENADRSGSLISLFVNDYEIEGHSIDEKLNIIEEMVLSFPHDTVLTEDRGVLNIGTAPSLAIDGLKLMINKLVDMERDIPNRIGVINTLALILKKKQPKEEGGLIRESYEEATDLLWYLRSKLNENGGVLAAYRNKGTVFLPNNPEWGMFFDSSGKSNIALLDEDLFEFDPEKLDIFYDITDDEIFTKVKDRGVRVYSAEFLNISNDTASIVRKNYNSQELVIIDRDIYERERNTPEVLLKRINAVIRSKKQKSVNEEEKKRDGRAANFLRSLVPGRFWKIAAVVLMAVALLYWVPGLIKNLPETSQNYYDVDPPEYSVGPVVGGSDVVEKTVPADRMSVAPVDGGMQKRGVYRSMTMPPQMSSGGGVSRYRYSYGSIAGDADGPLIRKVYPHLDENGNWSEDRDLELIETSDNNPAVEEVSVYMNVSPSSGIDPYERIDGEITNVRLLTNNGGSIPLVRKNGMFYPSGYSGPAWFSYDIDIDSGNRSLEYEERPLPRNEIDNMPDTWREFLDPFRGDDVPESNKREAVEYLMARDFAYNGQTKVFMRDSVSWTHSARRILEEKIVPKKFIEHFFGGYVLQHLVHNGWVDEINRDEVKVRDQEDRESGTLDLAPETVESLEEFLETGKVPVICNTSALYDYIFSRYVGLKAVYVTIERTENNKLYKNLVGHAMTLTRVDGRWQMNETTGYMPEIYPALDWVGGGAEERSSGGWLSKSGLYDIYSRTIGRDSWIERNIRNVNFIMALFIGFIAHGILLGLVFFSTLFAKAIRTLTFISRAKKVVPGKDVFTFFRFPRAEKVITFLELWYRKMGGAAMKSVFDKSFTIGNGDVVSMSNNVYNSSSKFLPKVSVTFESNSGNDWNVILTGFGDMRNLSPASAGGYLYVFKEGYTSMGKPEVSVVRRGYDAETVLNPEKLTGKRKNMKDTYVFNGSLYSLYGDKNTENVVRFDGDKILPVLVPGDKKEKVSDVRKIRHNGNEIIFAAHVQKEGEDIVRIYRAYKNGEERTDDILLEGEGEVTDWSIKVTSDGINVLYTKGGKIYLLDSGWDAKQQVYLTNLRVSGKDKLLREDPSGTSTVISGSFTDMTWDTRGNMLLMIAGSEEYKSLISCTKIPVEGDIGGVDTAVFVVPSIKKVRKEYPLSDEHIFEIIDENDDTKYIHCSAKGMWISDEMGYDKMVGLGDREDVGFYAYGDGSGDRNRIIAVKDEEEIFNYYSKELFLLNYKEPFAPVMHDGRVYILLYEQGGGDSLLHLLEISEEESRVVAINYNFTPEAPRTLSRVCSDMTGVPVSVFVPFDEELKDKVNTLKDMEEGKNGKISWKESWLPGSGEKRRARGEAEVNMYKHRNEIGNNILDSMADYGVPVEINEYVTGIQKEDKFYINGKQYPLFSYEDLTPAEKSDRDKKMEEDQEYIALLDEEARKEFFLRAGRIKRWHLCFLFMDKWIDYFEDRIPDDVLDFMDKYDVKPYMSRQDELRKTMDLISKFYIIGIPDASLIVLKYLSLMGSMPDMERDVRDALMKKWDIEGFPSPVQGIRLISERDKWDRLPTNLSFFLRYLSGDISTSLKEEDPVSVSSELVTLLDGGGESLSKLLALIKTISKDEVSSIGLDGVAGKYKEFPDKEYDKSDIKGAVNAQERVLPVWIRELVQNSRDAIREADAGGEGLKHRDINIRSYTNEGKWIVSVEDGLGMSIERLLKILLVPDATTKTLENDVLEILKLRKDKNETVNEMVGKLFKPEARNEASIRDELFLMLEEEPDRTRLSRMIVSKFQEKLIKTSGGFFGQGFFTVFSDADEVFVRSGKGGKVYELSLVPVYDRVSGEVVDIKMNWIREYDDPEGAYQGTEVRRIKKITPDKRGQIEIENAYLNYQAIKMIGGISEYDVYWNGKKVSDEMETIAREDGVEMRLSRSGIKRISIDQLYVQDLIPEIFEYMPDYISKKLVAEGLNVDFERGTPPVRTRNAIRNPSGYRPQLAVLALKAAGDLYKRGMIDLEYLPDYNSYMRSPMYDDYPVTRRMKDDAEYLISGKYLDDPDSDVFWKRFQTEYLDNSRAWQNLMLIMDDGIYPEKNSMYTEGVPRELIETFNGFRRAGITIKVPKLKSPLEDRKSVRREVLFNHIKLYAELFMENKVKINGSTLEGFLKSGVPVRKNPEISELAVKMSRDEPGWEDGINGNNWEETALYLTVESLNMSAFDLINGSIGTLEEDDESLSEILRGVGIDPEFGNRDEIKALSAVLGEFSDLLGIKAYGGTDAGLSKKITIDIKGGIIDSFLDFMETGNVGGLIDHYVSAVFNGDSRSYLNFYDTWLRGNINKDTMLKLISDISDISEIKTKTESLRTEIMDTKYPMAIAIEVKEDSPVRMEEDIGAVSLIGKVLDRDGNITEKAVSVRQINRSNKLEIRAANTETVTIPFYIDGEAPLIVEPGDVRNRLITLSDMEAIPGNIKTIVDGLIEKIGQEVKKVIALEEHETVKGAFGEYSAGEKVLFLNYHLLENPLALLHELGEGYVDIPVAYKNITRHTFMRGAGKDIRRALDILIDKGYDFDAPGNMIDAIEYELEDMTKSPGSGVSVSRTGHKENTGTFLTESEKDLIRWNFNSNNVKGRRALFGIQDWVDPEGNISFTEQLKILTSDMRRGTLNLFLIPETDSGEEAGSGVFTVHKSIERKFRKERGINTSIISFRQEFDPEEFNEKLEYMLEIATAEKNAGFLPKVCVDCPTKEHVDAVNSFIAEKQKIFKDIDVADIFGIVNDPLEPGDIVDEVKIVMIGSALMDDRRLKKIYEGNLYDDYFRERRMRMIRFFVGNNIMEDVFDYNDPEELDDIIDQIWNGTRSLYITKINWETLRDWKSSQDAVLRSL